MYPIESFTVADAGYFHHEHYHCMPGQDGKSVCADVVTSEGSVVLIDWYDMRGRTGHKDFTNDGK